MATVIYQLPIKDFCTRMYRYVLLFNVVSVVIKSHQKEIATSLFEVGYNICVCNDQFALVGLS